MGLNGRMYTRLQQWFKKAMFSSFKIKNLMFCECDVRQKSERGTIMLFLRI